MRWVLTNDSKNKRGLTQTLSSFAGVKIREKLQEVIVGSDYWRDMIGYP